MENRISAAVKIVQNHPDNGEELWAIVLALVFLSMLEDFLSFLTEHLIYKAEREAEAHQLYMSSPRVVRK